MKIASLSTGTLALVVDEGGATVVDIGASLTAFRERSPESAAAIASLLPTEEGGSWVALIDAWETVCEPLEELERWASSSGEAATAPLDSVRLVAPLAARDIAVFGIGANFTKHAAQAQSGGMLDEAQLSERSRAMLDAKADGAPPWGFTVHPRTILGPEAEVRCPPALARFDQEGEVAVVMRASKHGASIWGFTAWNDLSIRGHHFGEGPRVDEGPLNWALQKNFDGGNVCGPWITVDPAYDVQNLHIICRLNGEVRQDGSTQEMIYSFDEVSSYVSQFFTLQSGDIIASGTPAGTALESGAAGRYLREGDVLEVEIEGVGVLRNTVGPPAGTRPS